MKHEFANCTLSRTESFVANDNIVKEVVFSLHDCFGSKFISIQLFDKAQIDGRPCLGHG